MWPRWLRGLMTFWVAWDAGKRRAFTLFWAGLVLVLGPLMVPLYLACRPLLKGESRNGCLAWNLFWNFESLLAAVCGLATLGALAQNLESAKDRALPPVKQAEVKAGSIAGFLAMLVGIAVLRLVSGFIRETLEKDLPAQES